MSDWSLVDDRLLRVACTRRARLADMGWWDLLGGGRVGGQGGDTMWGHMHAAWDGSDMPLGVGHTLCMQARASLGYLSLLSRKAPHTQCMPGTPLPPPPPPVSKTPMTRTSTDTTLMGKAAARKMAAQAAVGPAPTAAAGRQRRQAERSTAHRAAFLLEE